MSKPQGSINLERGSPVYAFVIGSFFRLVFAKSFSCFSDIDSAIFFDAPFRLDFLISPRRAARAAPAAICCFFDFAGILSDRSAVKRWTYPFAVATSVRPTACAKPLRFLTEDENENENEDENEDD